MIDGLGEKQVSRRKFLEYFGLGVMSTALAACAPDKAFNKLAEATAEIDKGEFCKSSLWRG